MDGIKKAFLPHSSSGKKPQPKLVRKNAIKNINFVAPDTGENDDPFRLDGGESEESVETILKMLELENTDMLGIPPEMWELRSESRPSSGPLTFKTQPEESSPDTPQITVNNRDFTQTNGEKIVLEPPPARRNTGYYLSKAASGNVSSLFQENDSTSRATTVATGARLETSISAPATVLRPVPETRLRKMWSQSSDDGSSTGSQTSQSMGSRSSTTTSVVDEDDEPIESTVSWESWIKLEKLGSGSFGVVFKGVNCRGEFFAVKEISIPSVVNDSVNEEVSQLQQEIKFLQDCQHENIVQYLGTERTHTELYIFLELATEGSLVSLYKRFPLYDEQIRNYTRQILQGLKYLHDRNFVHRDLKCANILVQPNGKIKLADFGMAKQLEKIDSMRSTKGTAYWMAPEVMDPKKPAGLPSDIWSLGCTVLEMASGQPPFSGLPWTSVFWKVAHDGELPNVPNNLSEDTKDFIIQCLRHDPSTRPTTAMLLEHPLVTQAASNGNLGNVSSRTDSLEHRSQGRSQVRSVRTRPRSEDFRN